MTTFTEFVATRVAVRDAEELDQGIYDVLKKQLHNILKNLPTDVSTKFEPEIDALLKATLWVLSVEKTFATFGQQLLHLKYEKQTPVYKLRILGLLQIGSTYIKERLSNIFYRTDESRFAEMGNLIIQRLETAHSILNILSFVIFLRRGGPSTFFEHILKVKPVSTLKPSQRTIGYSFMTRELLWHGLIELLVLILPLINFYSLKRLFRKFIKGSSLKQMAKTQYCMTIDTKCPICRQAPILPYTMGCSHIFCYYCLSSHRLADQKFECPDCGFSSSDSSTTALKSCFLGKQP